MIEHITDDFGNPLINDIQTYGTYKSGKRKSPRDFPDILRAFSKLYNVTTDYLLELDNTPNHQVKAVKDVTGLSEDAVKNLMVFHNKYPELLEMIDVLLRNSSNEDISFFINLYKQIYNDYKDMQSGNTSSDYDIHKIEHRIILMQQMYNYIRSTVMQDLSATFDKQILIDEDLQNYYYSQEFTDSIPQIDDYDFGIEDEDSVRKQS